MATATNYHHVPLVSCLAQAMQPWLAYTCNPKDTPPGTAAFCRVKSYYNLQKAAIQEGFSWGLDQASKARAQRPTVETASDKSCGGGAACAPAVSVVPGNGLLPQIMHVEEA
jgi:hypothetical protein